MFSRVHRIPLNKIVFMVASVMLGFAPKAFASASIPDQCLYALNRTAPGALTISGSVDLNLSACGIVVDSSSNSAFVVSGSGTVIAKYIDVVGGYAGSEQVRFSAAPQTGAPYRSNPLRFLTPPTSNKCDYTNVSVSSGSSRLSPGTYCNGISISGTADVTIAPGTYILMGGGLRVSGSSQLTGQGAMKNARRKKDSGLAANIINGSRNSKLEGVLYFPRTALTWSGSSAGLKVLISRLWRTRSRLPDLPQSATTMVRCSAG